MVTQNVPVAFLWNYQERVAVQPIQVAIGEDRVVDSVWNPDARPEAIIGLRSDGLY